MQHINAPPRPVVELRPEVSPRLDAAVDRALAKEPEDRFPTMADFCAELEACLAELHSPGGSETMVIAPPKGVRRPKAPRARKQRSRPATPALLIAIGLAIAVAALAFAIVRERDSGNPGSGNTGGTPVALRGAGSYDPDGNDHTEHSERVSFATDGNPSTFWETSRYHYGAGGLGKAGVGLVLDAGSTVTLHQATITSDTPGFAAEIQAGNSEQGPFSTVGDSQTVASQTTYDLHGAKARYFVIWITRVPSSGQAHVNEVTAS
jgi:hypothetical protein